MSPNSIARIELINHKVTFAQAEVLVRVQVAQQSSTTEIRGRFVGPRCQGTTTIEVAYPLRPLPDADADVPNSLSRRVVIPEPSLWDVETPFLYEAIIELWEGEVCVDERRVMHGLRIRE